MTADNLQQPKHHITWARVSAYGIAGALVFRSFCGSVALSGDADIRVVRNAPTLAGGQRVFTNWLYYRVFAPVRGDIVISSTSDDDPAESRTGRVVGLPGERIRIIEGRVEVNGVPLHERYISDFGSPPPGVQFDRRISGILLLGDNRSREAFALPFHVVEVDPRKIQSRVFFVWSGWRCWGERDQTCFGFLDRPRFDDGGSYHESAPAVRAFFRL